MPFGEIAGEALGGVARLVGRLLVELVLEFVIQGTGRGVLRLLRPQHEPGDTAQAVAGLAVWAIVVAAGVGVCALSAS